MKPMLAHKYNPLIDYTGWYMSEKLDGVRSTYCDRQFMSRNEKQFLQSKGFDKSFPQNITLDGELFGGRGTFNETSGICRKKYNRDWSSLKYYVFEIPNFITPFKHTISYLNSNIRNRYNNLIVLPQTICSSKEHLQRFFERVITEGGEGVMLRHPDSYYEEGKRSSFLLKVKRFHKATCTVIGYENGKGKYSNVVGSLVCKFMNTTINIGSGLTDSDRINPPEIGSFIQFRYFSLSKENIPRFPTFIKVLS